MLELFLSFNWIYGCAFCAIFHKTFEMINISSNKSNIMACILLQLTFISTSFILLVKDICGYTENVSIDTSQNISLIYGYFIYDLLFLLFFSKKLKISFVIHHLIALGIIDTIYSNNTSDIFYNIASFVTEVTNPFINLRILLKNNTQLKTLNKKIIKLMYFVFRIVFYPSVCVAYIIYNNNNENIIYFMIMNICIYIFSLSWYNDILKL
jgi:hypothetical protein